LPDADQCSDLELLRNAAREAGEIAMRYFKREPEVWMKPGDSPVTEADYAVDKFLRETLMAARPDYGWLSEETVDSSERLDARRTFVVDPIDGTRAFIAGKSTWCVSVAVVEDGVAISGVLDCPAKKTVLMGATGKGATRDGREIAVRKPLDPPVIGGPKFLMKLLPPAMRAELPEVPYIPSLAYRLAMVAAGELDATFVKPNSHDWDIAAAMVILSEAGGQVRDIHGRTPALATRTTRHGALVAGSGPLLDKIAGVIVGLEA
jgi:myo-inositol-1(or 4)-monophosphatase